MVGVAAFAYALAHLSLYVVDQSYDLFHVASEIVLRFYLTIGFAALIGLATLAATSTDAMIRRLGAPNWNRLHKLVYLIAPLALLHFFLQAKANVAEPAMMTGLFFLLMLARFFTRFGWPQWAGALGFGADRRAGDRAGRSVVVRLCPPHPVRARVGREFQPAAGAAAELARRGGRRRAGRRRAGADGALARPRAGARRRRSEAAMARASAPAAMEGRATPPCSCGTGMARRRRRRAACRPRTAPAGRPPSPTGRPARSAGR